VAEVRAWAQGRWDIPSILLLEADPRAGERSLARAARRRRGLRDREEIRRGQLLEIERRLRAQGVRTIAGVDEVGRGPLAGPVVAAAVILPAEPDLRGLDDSKRLSPARREALSEEIRQHALAVGLGVVDPEEIDRTGIGQATMRAMREAIWGLALRPDRILIDGNQLPGSGSPEIAFVDGDARSLSIAAASVIAKVERDRMMAAFDRRYPGYGFHRNKGYGSDAHLNALRSLGPCPIHRRSFAPVGGGPETPDPAAENRDGTGRRGEEVAARLLERKGYTIAARNYRGGGGEIDLVVTKGDAIAFVEVKAAETGKGLSTPEARVDGGKRLRLARAASAYLRDMEPGDLAPRFDVVVVRLGERGDAAEHFEGAFRVR
jgi:ribonuclease HII